MCLTAGYEEVVVTEGKRNKMRGVSLASKVVEALIDYKKERDNRKNEDSKYLFVSQKGGNIDRTVLNRVIENTQIK